MTIRLHRGDLPDLSRYTDSVAIDTETMGLHPHRDRLCVVQMSNGDGSADVVQIPKDHTDAPNLKALLANPKIMKIFHFARFDLAALYNAFGVMPQPVYCTKIASRLTRTYTDRHGLKDLVREVLNIDLSKQQQSSDWGSRGAQRGAIGLCRLRRAASACAAGTARRHAGPRGPYRTRAGLFRIPADPGETRPAMAGTPRTFSRTRKGGRKSAPERRLPPRFGHTRGPSVWPRAVGGLWGRVPGDPVRAASSGNPG